MLTLITGAPGAGKTNYLIEKIRGYEKEGRPLFQHGIPELKLENTKIYCRNEDCEVCSNPPKSALYVDEWPEWAQTHYVIIIDEVQQVWRPRGQRDTDIPLGLRKLETHRHKGIDFWFMTQHPSFLDVHARRLVTSHIHIKNTWHGRMLYENPEVQMDPTKLQGGKLHNLDKSAFKEYQSADVHTKVKFKLPKALWIIGFFLLVCIPTIFYFFYSRFMAPDSRYVESVTGLSEISARSTPTETPQPTQTFFNSRSNDDVRNLDFTPRDIRYPATAPAFDDIAPIVSFPRVSACIHKPDPVNVTDDYCQCYSQQGTKLVLPVEVCIDYTQGNTFDPFTPDSPGRESVSD